MTAAKKDELIGEVRRSQLVRGGGFEIPRTARDGILRDASKSRMVRTKNAPF
jgi:hypothetical protein